MGVGPPASGATSRCALFPNPMTVQTMSWFGTSPAPHAHLVVDVGAEAIWAKDANTEALLGSAWRSHVAATPSTYRPAMVRMHGYTNYLVAPQLTLSSPSRPALQITCLDGDLGAFSYQWCRQEFTRRFAWRGDVPTVTTPAAYSVSAVDWRTLVDAVGRSVCVSRGAGLTLE